MKVFSFDLLLAVNFLCCLGLEGEKFGDSKRSIEDEWLDPGNIFEYDRGKRGYPENSLCDGNKEAGCGELQEKLLQCQRDLEKLPQNSQHKVAGNKSACDTPYFKKVARILLNNIEKKGQHEVFIAASQDDVTTLEKFVSSSDGNVQDVCEIISHIFEGNDDLFGFSWKDALFDFKPHLLVFGLIFLILLLIYFKRHTNLTWTFQFWSVFKWCFIISIPWEWYYLYRKSFAAKQAELEKEMPKECRPAGKMQPFDYLIGWLQNTVTFRRDACVQYYETFLVDPMWEVSPSRALSATFTTIITHPFEDFAEAIGKSFRALFREVPIQWQPFVFLAVVVISIITIFALSGLQVKFPFVTIETVPSLALEANFQKTQRQGQTALEMLQQLIEAHGERDVHENNMQRQINTLLNTLNENAQRVDERTEPLPGLEYQDGIHLQGDVGAAEERPDKQRVTGTPSEAISAHNSGIEEVPLM